MKIFKSASSTTTLVVRQIFKRAHVLFLKQMDLSVCSYCEDTYYRSFYVGGGWRALQRVTINPRCVARPRRRRRSGIL